MGASGACWGGPAYHWPVGSWPWPCWGTQSRGGPLPSPPMHWPGSCSPPSPAQAGHPLHLQVAKSLFQGPQLLAASPGCPPGPPVPQMVPGLSRAAPGAQSPSAPGPSSSGSGFAQGPPAQTRLLEAGAEVEAASPPCRWIQLKSFL